MLVAGLLYAAPPGVDAADVRPRQGAVDPAKARAQAADRERLVAKLRGEAPKLTDTPPAANPLDAPIFRRYDRP
jgi:hypothetical protein